MRGQAACRYWGGGATPSENIPAGLAHLTALLKQLWRRSLCLGQSPWLRVWGGDSQSLGSSMAWLCPAPWCGLAWEKGKNG